MSWSPEEKDAVARLATRFGGIPLPVAIEHAPAEVVRDLCLNLAKVLDGEETVPRAERLLLAVGVAFAAGATPWVEWLRQVAHQRGVASALCEAACAVAWTCNTYNGYYKFRALANDHAFDAFPAGLRATPFVRSALEKRLVELLCVVVSSHNGCSHCVRGHVHTARQEGASDAAIDEAVRLGAVIGALVQLG